MNQKKASNNHSPRHPERSEGSPDYGALPGSEVPRFARDDGRVKKRIVNGLLLVNKPCGLTSNAVLQQVKRLFSAQKAGHTGSLDPLATGMLPVCFGEATKYSQYLLDADKCYEVTGLLGIKTNTADAMGEVTARVDTFHVSKQQFQSVLSEFSGSIKQTPSMFSALKHKGQPLYKLAREGIEVDRKARPITIHQLQLNAFDGREFKLTVTCSKGTYIRNLVEDIGDRLGIGAHVTQLHRVYTLRLENERMYTLDELKDQSPELLLKSLLPVDRMIDDLPILHLDVERVQALKQGKTVNIPEALDSAGCVRLYDQHEQFIGLGEWEIPGVLKPRRLLSYMQGKGDIKMSTDEILALTRK
jgi:tRNA pseudouridine55 synthase